MAERRDSPQDNAPCFQQCRTRAWTGEVPKTLNPVQTFTTSVSVPQGALWGPLPAQPCLATTPQARCLLPPPPGELLQQGHLHTSLQVSFFARSCT